MIKWKIKFVAINIINLKTTVKNNTNNTVVKGHVMAINIINSVPFVILIIVNS